MPEDRNAVAPAGVAIQVTARLHESPKGETAPRAVAYAFTGSGHFITRAAVNETGTATLTVPAEESPREVRVIVGPEIQEEVPALSNLTRRGAQEQFLKVTASSSGLRANFEIPSLIWICWNRQCFVKGTLLKRLLNVGAPADYPVCDTDIQIWEVEPVFLILPKLSDIDLEILRRYLLNTKPLPPNPPDPGPLALARFGQLEIARPVETSPHFMPPSPELSGLHAVARSGDIASLRNALASSEESIIRPLICLLYPALVTKRLIALTKTDRCGHFQTFVVLSCYESTNLYFTASVDLFGAPIHIYNPTPVACYTHWNYQCGSEVTLFTNSAAAPLCGQCQPGDAPENSVTIRAIGNIPLTGIMEPASISATPWPPTRPTKASPQIFGILFLTRRASMKT